MNLLRGHYELCFFNNFIKKLIPFVIIVIFIGCITKPTIVSQNNTEYPLKSDTVYFTAEFVKKIIIEPNLSVDNIIFDRTKFDNLTFTDNPIMYDANGQRISNPQGKLIPFGGGYIPSDSNILVHQFQYENYLIILATQKINNIEYVCDYLLVKKQNHETYSNICADNVLIDGKPCPYCRTTCLIVVINNSNWRLYTEDISEAFIVNIKTKKFEPINFKTIRFFSEI